MAARFNIDHVNNITNLEPSNDEQKKKEKFTHTKYTSSSLRGPVINSSYSDVKERYVCSFEREVLKTPGLENHS